MFYVVNSTSGLGNSMLHAWCQYIKVREMCMNVVILGV